MSNVYLDALEDVEKKFKVHSAVLDLEAMKKWRISSGSLALDLVLGGGYVAGWVRNWGEEGSAKTTSSQQTTCVQLKREHRPPINMYWDYENAVNPDIIENILKNILGDNTSVDYDKLFGLKDPATGKWVVDPIVRYYSPVAGEVFYNVMNSILKKLPNKEFIADSKHPDGGRWYKVFDNTKENKKYVGDTFDKKLYQTTKMYYVEDETGGTPQLIAIVDSLQAMTPEANIGDETTNAKGVDARMHGENLSRIRGQLRSKHALIITIGQLREKPMVIYGSPEYTPGGNALNHADDVRNRFKKRASPNGNDNVDKKSGFEVEPSVLSADGTDSYQYIHVKNQKNKYGLPKRECWLRVWVDHTGKSRGFCPAYDVYMFLKSTGRILESSDGTDGKIYKKFTVVWEEKEGFEELQFTWLEFKAMVLGGKEVLKDVCLRKGIKKNPKLLETCFNEIREGNAVQLFVDNLLGGETEDD